MRRCFWLIAGLLLGLLSWAATAQTRLPTAVPQGGLLVGVTDPAASVRSGGRQIRVAGDGRFLIGVPRDARGPLVVEIDTADGVHDRLEVRVDPVEWPHEDVNGVPPATVEPPPEIAARIAREQAAVAAVRGHDDDRADFGQALIWPVNARRSGHFGSHRRYNGKPGSPHSGVDLAAPAGTPVHAPAGGIVTFASPDLYLTGGTLVIDHGHGLSSVFLHLSRIDVAVGNRIEQGQAIAAVGATGRATGPHLHWGMNWFDIRLDPERVLAQGFAAP